MRISRQVGANCGNSRCQLQFCCVPQAAYRQLPQHPSSVFLLLLLQIIGRLASYLSVILQGKDKPIFSPNKDLGDICVVVNAEKAVFTGNKWEGKVYKWHTGKQQLCWAQAASLSNTMARSGPGGVYGWMGGWHGVCTERLVREFTTALP